MTTGGAMRWVLVETAPWGHRMRLPGQHLAEWLLERGHTVAYVSAPVSPWHFLSRGRRTDARHRWNLEGPVGRWRGERLFAFIPRTLLPVHRQWPLDGNMTWNGSERFSFPRAGAVLREAGFDRADVLVMHNLQIPHLVRAVQPRVFVARMEDNIAEFPEMPRVIVRREHEIIADADMVTITAEGLRARAEKAGAIRIHAMPNGVNSARFRRPESLPPRPADMPPGPVAVYVGALDGWFHATLLAQVARALPAWRFLLIGPRRHAMPALDACANVAFLGAKPQEEVPPYLWHGTAGIIPFQRTRLIESVCPLKLFEYAVASLPVVATRWAEMERLKSPAALCDDAPAFAAALEAAAQPDSARQRESIAYGEAHDWNRIFGRFEDAVRALRAEAEA